MSALFGHGQLRLYLVTLLAEGERSGYDVIRELQDRFPGMYSPSAGTIYPRLAKLEEEGLVTRRQMGRRSVYALTETGLREMEDRRAEIVSLEADLDQAWEARSREFADSVADLRREIEDGAASLREQFSRARALVGEPAAPGGPWARACDPAPGASEASRSRPVPEPGGPPSAGQLREIAAIAREAAERIRVVLTGTGAAGGPPPGGGTPRVRPWTDGPGGA